MDDQHDSQPGQRLDPRRAHLRRHHPAALRQRHPSRHQRRRRHHPVEPRPVVDRRQLALRRVLPRLDRRSPRLQPRPVGHRDPDRHGHPAGARHAPTPPPPPRPPRSPPPPPAPPRSTSPGPPPPTTSPSPATASSAAQAPAAPTSPRSAPPPPPTSATPASPPAPPTRYRVRATDAAGNVSPYSTTASAPPRPRRHHPTEPADRADRHRRRPGQINLTWTAATDNVAVTGYRIERCPGTGCTNFAEIATPATTSFTDSGLLTATTTCTTASAPPTPPATSAPTPTPPAPPPATAASGLVAGWYSFDEGAGLSVGDVSGNTNTGTISGGTSWVPASTAALSFDAPPDASACRHRHRSGCHRR